VSTTVGYKTWTRMTQDEQGKFFNKIGKDKIKEMTIKGLVNAVRKHFQGASWQRLPGSLFPKHAGLRT
jgi:hypothetical protein